METILNAVYLFGVILGAVCVMDITAYSIKKAPARATFNLWTWRIGLVLLAAGINGLWF